MVLRPSLFNPVSPTEKYCFTLLGLAILQLSQTRGALKIAIPRFTTEARVVMQTHNGFSTGVPSAVVFVCRRKCVAGKLPCNALTFVCALCAVRLPSSCHHRRVSSLRPRICLVGRTVAPSQLQAAPTPRRCGRWSQQGQKRPNK